jgi:hypothetical protein
MVASVLGRGITGEVRAEKLGLTRHGLADGGRLSLLDRVIPVPDG